MSIDDNKKDMCLIVGSSDFFMNGNLDLDSAFIIAADGGYGHLQKLNIKPDMVIGDFDSLGHIPSFDNITVLPRVKDDTDSFYAAKKALSMGYERFYFCGCTGGEREDHTYANIAMMRYLCRRGADCIMEGERQYYKVVRGPSKLVFNDDKGYFSVFSLSETAEGVSMHGFEYETDSITISCDVPLGVSNRFGGGVCTFELQKGEVLLVWEK